METITINASVKDTIERIIRFRNYPKNIQEYKNNYKYESIGNGTSKEEIINMLNNCIEFDIKDDNIIFTVHKTEEEIKEEILFLKYNFNYHVNELKRYYNLNNYLKGQIITYLNKYNLNWIFNLIE